MKRPDALRALAGGAAIVTIALTAAAFWLSYEHLHDVAHGNGLNDAARSWAWPATVDLFIVTGELLILRASLRGRVDWWAIGLAATGSLGSIALNIAGVGAGASRMEYIVAAVPPVAALLAFGALMRQVHDALERITASETTATASPTPVPAPAASATPPAPAQKPASHLPAAGASRVPAPASPPRQPAAKPALPAPPPVADPQAEQPATPASASDATTARSLDEVAVAYRTLRASLGVRRPSSAKLGEALGVSRSRGQQLRDELEKHPKYAAEFAPALKSA